MTLGLFRPAGRRRFIKRRMLRAAVEENLDVINGVPPRSRRRPRSFALPAFLVVALFGLMANSAQVGTSPNANRTSLALEPVGPTIDNRGPVPASRAGVMLAAPQAIDPAVFRLAVRKIVIDPGHGGSDPGAVTRQGLAEKDLTLDIGLRLAALLQAEGHQVVLTRDSDSTLTLQQRTEIANTAKGDLFVSIHINVIPVALRRGIETYYLGATTDPQVERLAKVENSVSGYSLADFKELLERVYTDVRQEESRRLADAVQSRLFASLREANPGLEDRGVKRAPFVVLIGTAMPSILAEVSCISNQDEVRLLRRNDYRQSIARALATGLRSYAASRSQVQVASRHQKQAS